SEALSLLRNALKSAKFDCPKEAKMDFSMVDIAFWQETEPAFRGVYSGPERHPDGNPCRPT
ncbi:hypothetical protein MJM43_29665, partial [Salmonella enterica subsp. enterica serovar Montevideo]|nr:hypothetical protein [Salmonella enterica subsp. enterica serovar Montevideo]